MRWRNHCLAGLAITLAISLPPALAADEEIINPYPREVIRREAGRIVPHPLQIVQTEASDREVAALVKNHSAAPIEFSVGGAKFTAPADGIAKATLKTNPAKPFETVTVVVESKDLPPLRRNVFLHHENAAGTWKSIVSPALALRVATDGSGARLEAGGKVVAVLAPLVLRNGAAVPLKLESTVGLRLAGDGVSVRLALAGDEVSVSITSDRPCEGPAVRAIGPLQTGLLAGLEYLGKGERSSSTLDIETPAHLRFAPDPLKVTMPLVACVTDRAAVAMTWNDMALQPVYATPNFFDGTADHRMALRGTKIEATILVRRTSLENAILWAVKRRGLPPLPAPPRDRAAQWKLCMDAFNGPIKGDGGWGHCAESRWPRNYYADFASVIWRITGTVPDMPHLAAGGGHIRNDAVYFVTGRAGQWLDMRRAEARRQVHTQSPDGSYHYQGKYLRGHYEDTASGCCALPAETLLEFARMTGDREALAAGLKTLDYMKRFDVPRGAQVWELSLHTPDILASAHLVRAYVRGYELTGRREYLDEARRWALSGVPFVYQWGQHPVMPYSTIAVYGATNWQAPNWMGLPVQWCGLVYAYALTLLAPHDKTLDWNHLARGILIAGEQMQSPDGPMVGCLPDSFVLSGQKRQGPYINPSALVCLRLALGGEPEGLAVASEGDRRAVAPYPVTIRGGKAVIRAKEGAAYQVLIDGKRVVDVKSRGQDEVPLD